MNRSNTFFSALRLHNELQSAFNDFCETCAKALNDNSAYPGASFEFSEKSCSAQLSAFGESFHIYYRPYLSETPKVGLVKAVLSGENKPDVLLTHFFFDEMYLARDAIDDSHNMHAIHEKEFVKRFLNLLAINFLKYEKATFEESLPQTNTQ